MREIVIDTETTGFDPKDGHRLIDIGCVELLNLVPTGKTFQRYVNPQRSIPEEAVRVHGLTSDFLQSYPVFSAIAHDFLDFISDSPLIAHNAEFDMRFINFELLSAGLDPIPMKRAVDTLQLARARFPGSPNTLDALCKRLGVDNSDRTQHGALLDSKILASVYLELRGGRQTGLDFVANPSRSQLSREKKTRPPRSFPASPEELEAHHAFLKSLKEPIWSK